MVFRNSEQHNRRGMPVAERHRRSSLPVHRCCCRRQELGRRRRLVRRISECSRFPSSPMPPRHPSDRRTVVGTRLLPTDRTRMCRRRRPSGGHPRRRLGSKPLPEPSTIRRRASRRHRTTPAMRIRPRTINRASVVASASRAAEMGKVIFPREAGSPPTLLCASDTRHHQLDQGVSPSCIARHRQVCLVHLSNWRHTTAPPV